MVHAVRRPLRKEAKTSRKKTYDIIQDHRELRFRCLSLSEATRLSQQDPQLVSVSSYFSNLVRWAFDAEAFRYPTVIVSEKLKTGKEPNMLHVLTLFRIVVCPTSLQEKARKASEFTFFML